jgi:hypothetical protein
MTRVYTSTPPEALEEPYNQSCVREGFFGQAGLSQRFGRYGCGADDGAGRGAGVRGRLRSEEQLVWELSLLDQ